MDVCEVFSPPRVSYQAVKFGMEAGDAMDPITRWDFNIVEHRRQAETYVERENPLVLIGISPCVAFGQLQSFVRESEREFKQLAEGIRHTEFVAKLHTKQVEGCQFVVHENSAHAKSRDGLAFAG